MQGRKFLITPAQEQRILAALNSDERPTYKLLTKRFGMSKDRLLEVKQKHERTSTKTGEE